MAKTTLTMSLPEVGERLVRVMSSTRFHTGDTYAPVSCIVTYVNALHNWFMVQFLDSGLKECYGLPTFDHSILYHTSKGSVPVLCFENGTVYSSVRQCADDLGLIRQNISAQLNGLKNQCNGYHFYRII